MPLAEKITELRKKQGWSQIDLAERLDVSRQSVSKWEMAQAVPELDKIIKMSELFSVSTDYLLKDAAPAPRSGGGGVPPAAPEPASGPREARPEKSGWKRWPWVIGVFLLLLAAAAVIWAAGRFRQDAATFGQGAEISSGGEAAYTGEPESPQGMSAFTYDGAAVTGGTMDEAELEAIAEEYAPYGITCDHEGRWYFEGQPIRVFTDILSSNGESLTGGSFQGSLRNYAGEGEIDVRTVRDFAHHDGQDHGTLLCVETCPAHGEPVWTQHHAGSGASGGHHGEEHHG